MTSKLPLLAIALLCLVTLAACAPGSNPSAGTPGIQNQVAGFWLGIWHGFIAPFVFVGSLFKSGLTIYEVHNNGAWYNFGYLFGLVCILGGGGNRTGRRK